LRIADEYLVKPRYWGIDLGGIYKERVSDRAYPNTRGMGMEVRVLKTGYPAIRKRINLRVWVRAFKREYVGNLLSP